MSEQVDKISLQEEQSTQLLDDDEEVKNNGDLVAHISDPDEDASPNDKLYNLETINDEEEIKLPADTLPIIMTNVKHGRHNMLNDQIKDLKVDGQRTIKKQDLI